MAREPGYAKISVKREVYKRLRSIAESRGLTMSEVIAQLLEYADLGSRVEGVLAAIKSTVEEIHATISSINATLGSMDTTRSSMVNTTSGSTRPEENPGTAAASTTKQSSPSNVTGKGTTSPPRDSPSRDPGTGEKGQKVVRWVKVDRVRDLEAYFRSIEEREGREVLWVDKDGRWACWAYRDEVEGVVEELNGERVPLNAIRGHPEGWELYDCGLIMFRNGEWAAIG